MVEAAPHGMALLGANAVIALGDLTPEQAAQAAQVPTIVLQFAFMVISAPLRLGGLYGAVTRGIAGLQVGPVLLGLLVLWAVLMWQLLHAPRAV